MALSRSKVTAYSPASDCPAIYSRLLPSLCCREGGRRLRQLCVDKAVGTASANDVSCCTPRGLGFTGGPRLITLNNQLMKSRRKPSQLEFHLHSGDLKGYGTEETIMVVADRGAGSTSSYSDTDLGLCAIHRCSSLSCISILQDMLLYISVSTTRCSRCAVVRRPRPMVRNRHSWFHIAHQHLDSADRLI